MVYGEDYNSFVYEWTDLKTGKKYIGSHLGSTDDGYVGSGLYFRRAYTVRPEQFTRKILEYCTVDNATQLQSQYEQKYLDNIQNINEYFNISLNAVCPAGWNKGLTKETNPNFSNSGRPKGLDSWSNGKKYTQKVKRDNTNIAISNKNKAKDPEWLRKNKEAHNRPEVKAKKKIAAALSSGNKGKVWINNGIKNKMIEKDQEILPGYLYGKLQRK